MQDIITIQYKANRVPTVRECARIQSFPILTFMVSNQSIQAGWECVPPLLGYELGKSALRALSNV